MRIGHKINRSEGAKVFDVLESKRIKRPYNIDRTIAQLQNITRILFLEYG